MTSDPERLAASPGLGRQVAAWVGQEVPSGRGAAVNANGAGDAFGGGLRVRRVELLLWLILKLLWDQEAPHDRHMT